MSFLGSRCVACQALAIPIAVSLSLGTLVATDEGARLEEQREMLEGMTEELPRLLNEESEMAVPRLSEIVYLTAMPHIFQVDEKNHINHLAKVALLGIDGHAKHQALMVKETRENLMAFRSGKPFPNSNHLGNSYDLARSVAFNTLAQLPSLESVEVLGGFLRDFEWIGYTGNPRYAKRPGAIPPNGVLAARALGELIEKPPVQKEPRLYSFDDAEIWQLWFEQVKAGSRTFRFKGNPQEFTLAGPAESAKSPLTDRPSKRETAPSRIAAIKTPVSLWKVAVIPASLLLCGIALWRSLRQRTRAKA